MLNATEDPPLIRDCYYTMSCTLTDLWLASVAYQKERSLRLVRNRQSSQETAKTTLATLPNELFEHILTFVREDAHTDYFDTFPYVQICECVNVEKAWTKQIVMEAFNEWGKTNFKCMAANPPGHLLTKADPRWLDHHKEYENTEEFSQLLSFAAYGSFPECDKCIARWERFWRDIGDRRRPESAASIQAVAVVKTFLHDHHLIAVENECWDDNYTDNGGEDAGSAEYFAAYIGPIEHFYPKSSRYTEKKPYTAAAADVPFSAGLLSLAKTHRLSNLRWVCLGLEEVYDEEENKANGIEADELESEDKSEAQQVIADIQAQAQVQATEASSVQGV